MFRRLRILTLLQLSDRLNLKKYKDSAKLATTITISIVGLGLFTGIYCGILYLLCDLIMIPKNQTILTFVLFFIQILSVIACTHGLNKTLYFGKDNMILLSYPANHHEVFLSKLIVYYVYEFIKNFFFMLPLLISIGIMFKIFSVHYIIATILFLIFLPMFPVLIGAVLTLPLLLIKNLLKKIPLIREIEVVGLLVLLFLLIVRIMEVIPVPLRIVALYNQFMTNFTNFIVNINKYSLFYNNIGEILFSENLLVNYLILFGILIGLLAIVILLSMPLYFRLASKSQEQANVKKHRNVNKANKNIFLTFFRKEWILTKRNIGDFVNNYIFMFATPFVVFIMTSIITAIDRNQLGYSLTTASIGLVILMMASASNTASALAITQEGSEFVLLKTAPADATKMAWAKIFFNLSFSTIMIIISYVVVTIFCKRLTDLPTVWLLCGGTILVNAALIFWSFELDIKNPSLREYASNNDASTIKNVSTSIKIGLVLSFIYAVIVVLALYFAYGLIANIIIIAVPLLFLGVRFFFFWNYLKYVFPRIEY